ncbi:MAG TPA: 50S ribosomal protein L11 methyltransferase [Terriglobales bacterium]|nr:50S ribosomal protein L11 methyltransferase [Terriglobales bacterium]
MYSLRDYGSMIHDSVRMNAYEEALRRSVTPGSVVVDLGCGLGLMAALAVRLGAARVFAIEADDIIQVARDCAVANNCTDRIEFIHGLSSDVTLPSPADVIVSDLRGILPMLGLAIPSLIDARQRLLRPNGVLIPQIDTLWVAAAEAPDLYANELKGLTANRYSFDLGPAVTAATHSIWRADLKSGQLLTEPRTWATLDYRSRNSPHCEGNTTLHAERNGLGHGLCLWFSTQLYENVGFSCAPGAPTRIYGQILLPWPQPMPIETGDRVEVSISAHLVSGDYLWRWNTTLWRGETMLTELTQSSLPSILISQERLHKSASAYRPELNFEGQIQRFILEQMNGAHSLAEIAEELTRRHPDRFATLQQALDRVAKISREFS